MTEQDFENIKISGAERSPEIDFDFKNGVFTVRGESYPEDVIAFYGETISQLSAYLSASASRKIEFNFELIYFNSSTAKILMDLFDRLDEAAAGGNTVVINWYYDEEDDTMQELGEEFAEDLESASFNMMKLED